MVKEACTVVDDAIYLHEVDMVISAFYLFLDILVPEVASANQVSFLVPLSLQTTPLLQASSLYSRIQPHCDNNLVEITTVLQFFHQELVFTSYQLKELVANTKQQSMRIENYLESFHIHPQSIQKFEQPFLVKLIGESQECNFLIEEFIREKKFERGLLGQELNELLCRDFLRRMFTMWKIAFPPRLMEPLQNLLFTLFSKNQSISVLTVLVIDF